MGRNVKGRTGLLPYSPPPVPQSGSTLPIVWLLSAAFVTSECVFGAPVDACMKFCRFFSLPTGA